MRARRPRPLQVLDGHENAVQSLAYSPQRLLLASGSADKTVRVWNLDTLTLKRTYSGPRDFVTSVAFSQSGKLLAAGSLDGRIQIWSVLSHAPPALAERPHAAASPTSPSRPRAISSPRRARTAPCGCGICSVGASSAR